MIVVAYYTVGTPYESLVKGFRESLGVSNPDLKVVIQPVLCQGSWEINCSQKSSVLLELLTGLKDDLLYIDIDAVVKRKIEVPENEEDISVYFKDGELLSGTIFIRNTIEAREILHWWEEAQKKNLCTWDQQVLQKVVKDKKIKVGSLDEKMCSIFDSKGRSKEPIIVHNQVSRQFKKLIGGDVMDIPKVVGKMRVIHNRDGTVSIARKNREAEKWLDDNLLRMPNQLRWQPKSSPKDSVDKLILQGKELYIIGKGPSLDNISKKDFPNKKAPIFAVNESIHKIESLGLPNDTYVIVQDVDIVKACQPKKAGVICPTSLKNHFSEIENVFLFNKGDFFKHHNYTPVLAINIAKKSGITDFKMLCFDSIVNGDKKYANVIGYQHPKTNDKKRYERNEFGINEALKDMENVFICPEAKKPHKPKFDKSLPKPDKSSEESSESRN